MKRIRRSVCSHVFTFIVPYFLYSRIDYCNTLLIGLRKFRVFTLQSVRNATARLITRLPHTSFHISAFKFDHFHSLPSLTEFNTMSLHEATGPVSNTQVST